MLYSLGSKNIIIIINENKIKVGYIPTKEQLADGFTKGLDNTKHITLIENVRLKESKII